MANVICIACKAKTLGRNLKKFILCYKIYLHSHIWIALHIFPFKPQTHFKLNSPVRASLLNKWSGIMRSRIWALVSDLGILLIERDRHLTSGTPDPPFDDCSFAPPHPPPSHAIPVYSFTFSPFDCSLFQLKIPCTKLAAFHVGWQNEILLIMISL